MTLRTVTRYLGPAWFDEARRIVQEPALRRCLAGRPLSGRVLNAGCGEGLYAPLLEGFAGVTAIFNMDLARPSVARRRPDARHCDQQGSLTALPYQSASFDTVLCSEVLEHVHADVDAVRELARVLKPGGLLLISVPTPPAPLDRAHVREGYTRQQLATLLAGAGLHMRASAVCMHAGMRWLYGAWQWQYRGCGRNLFPRPVLQAIARADRASRIGKPWDLVVLAEKGGEKEAIGEPRPG